jgi:hypothetical protein
MSREVFDISYSMLSAAAFKMEDGLDGIEGSDIRRVVKRMSYMLMPFSGLFSFEWDASIPSVVMRRRSDEDDAPGHEMAKNVNDRIRITTVFAKAIRNPVTVPEQHYALVRLGKSVRTSFARMDKHMRKLLEAEAEANANTEANAEATEKNQDGGFSKRSPYVRMVQMQEVIARLLVEEMLWWMNLESVKETMCDTSVHPEEEIDRIRFESRARAFRAVVPLLHARIREFGLLRIGRIFATEARCIFRRAYLETTKGEEADGSGSPTPTETKNLPTVLPSVDDMLKSIDSLNYYLFPQAPEDEESIFQLLAEHAHNPPRASPKIDKAQLEEGMQTARRRGARMRTDDPDRVDADLAERVSSVGMFPIAYDLRLPEYLHGIRAARVIVSIALKKIMKSLQPQPQPQPEPGAE